MVLPYYLAIGMPYEVFWYEKPTMVKAYLKAHELRNMQKNQEMWVQGIYNFKAFRSVIEAFAIGLSEKKSGKPSEYPSEPIPFTETEKEMATERNKQRTLQWVKNNQ